MPKIGLVFNIVLFVYMCYYKVNEQDFPKLQLIVE